MLMLQEHLGAFNIAPFSAKVRLAKVYLIAVAIRVATYQIEPSCRNVFLQVVASFTVVKPVLSFPRLELALSITTLVDEFHATCYGDPFAEQSRRQHSRPAVSPPVI